MAAPTKSLLSSFLSAPKAIPWPSVFSEDALRLSPIFDTLMVPVDHDAQSWGNIDLSFFSKTKFWMSVIRVLFSKSSTNLSENPSPRP